MNNETAALNGLGQLWLPLAGYDKWSVWGYDPMMDALFAQLWLDTDNGFDTPRIWISPGGRWPATTSVDKLAGYIAEATGRSESEVRRALATYAPAAVREHLLTAA